MMRRYTDAELASLRLLPKQVVNPGARWSEKPADRPVEKQRVFRARATSVDGQDHWFLVYQRLNIRDRSNYSCGVVYLPTGAPKLTLARYNGSSHRHGDISYKTHIHRATEAAIAAGRKPESEADVTTRYNTCDGAFRCLIQDFNLSGVRTPPDQPSLFDVDPN